MKYIFLSIFLSLLISSTINEQTSYLKKTSILKINNSTHDPTIKPKSYNGYCFMKMNNNFYDLHAFNTIKPWKITDKLGNIIHFNFCQNIDTTCRKDDVLIAVDKDCKKLAGMSDQEKTWTIKAVNNTSVITLSLPTGDICATNRRYQTTVELTCDTKSNVPVINNDFTFDQNKCENVIKMSSKHGIFNKNINLF